jgi:hypothetical protein
VDVVGCGERTENLFDKENLSMIYSGYIYTTTNQVVPSEKGSLSIIVPVKPNSNYTISKLATTRFRVGLFTNYPVEGSIATAIYGDREGAGIDYGTTLSFSTSTDTAYIMAFIRNYDDTVTQEEMLPSVMVNEGATALPYEPYGYKLPPKVNGTEYPIYLGQVPTTRRIKKLVLTGDENWGVNANTKVFYCNISQALLVDGVLTSACTHYVASENKSNYAYLSNNSCCIRWNYSVLWIRDLSRSNVDDFKSYLQQ